MDENTKCEKCQGEMKKMEDGSMKCDCVTTTPAAEATPAA